MKTKQQTRSKKKAFSSTFRQKMESEQMQRQHLVLKMERLLWQFSIIIGCLTFLSVAGYIYLDSLGAESQIAPDINNEILIEPDLQSNSNQDAVEFDFSN